jgi:hypothetical protein
LHAIAGGLPGGHRIVRIVVVAGTIAVAVHGRAVALPDALVDLPVVLAARGTPSIFSSACAVAGEVAILPGLSWL